eukprot:5973130-Pyramimonas_sp.AAC.1
MTRAAGRPAAPAPPSPRRPRPTSSSEACGGAATARRLWAVAAARVSSSCVYSPFVSLAHPPEDGGRVRRSWRDTRRG